MGLFTREQFAEPNDDAGIFINDLGRALVIWATMQGRYPTTVHEAAKAFNTTPQIITEAVENADWIYIVGDNLELDGE